MPTVGPQYVGAGGSTAVSGTWTTLANAEGSGTGAYAGWTSTTRNGTATWQGAGFNFSAVPAGATITNVFVEVQHHETSTSAITAVTGQLLISGTSVGAAQTFTRATTDQIDSWNVASGVAQSDLANLQVQVTVTRGNTTTSATEDVDFARVTVTYTIPSFTGSGGLNSSSPGATSFDALGPSSSGAHSATSPLTWTHVDGGSANCILAGLAIDGGTATGGTTPANNPVTAFTYAGTSFGSTLLNWQAGGSAQAAGYLALYKLLNPATGSNSVSATVNTSGGQGVDSISGGSLSFGGVGSLGTPVHTDSNGVAVTSGSITVATTDPNSIVAVFVTNGSGGTAFTAGTSRIVSVNSGQAGAAETIAAATIAGTGGNVTVTWTQTSDWYAAIAVELIPAAGSAGKKASISGTGSVTTPPITGSGGLRAKKASVSGGSAKSVITGLGGTGTGYFIDQFGSPKLLICDNPWALPPNAGRWDSGSYQTTYDNYLSTRASQGVNGIYVSPYGNANNHCLFTDGRTWDGIYPFNSGSSNDPSSGLNNTFFQRIDYMLTKAQALGITVLMNIGYAGGSADMDTGGCLAGKTTTQYTDYGTALGNRYKNQPNIIWIVGNDYFGSYDSAYTAILNGLRAAGDNHVIAIHNFVESTSRFDLSNNAACSWGTSHSQFNFYYSYDCTYLGAEYAYAESSPLMVFYGDGYFYQGNSTYQGGSSFAYDRSIRQELWWALASAARGANQGDEGIWQWPSGAQSQAANGWFWAHSVGNIRTAVEALPGWYNLLPATGTSLITAGRGTRATQFASGGGGGQYEPAYSNSYVAASKTADGSLALLYLPNAATITIDQTAVGGAGNYTAKRMDPITGTLTALTPGSTYNSGSWGSNSQGDPDWVLVFQSTPTITGSGGLSHKKASASGTGTVTANITGSGGLSHKKAAVTGAGSEAFSATGSAAHKKPSVNSAGTESFAGSGGSATKKPAASGSGTLVPYVGSGSIAAKKPTAAASGTLAFTGPGGVTHRKPSASGSGAETFTGSGAPLTRKPVITGSGSYTPAGLSGSGGLVAKKPASSASGTETFGGSASPSARKAAITGSGGLGGAPVTGSGGLAAKKPGAASSGTETFTGPGAALLKKPAASGAGSAGAAPIAGSGSAQIRKPAVTAAGLTGFASGSGGLTARKPSASGSATQTSASTGNLNTRKPSASGSGTVTGAPVTGSGGLVLKKSAPSGVSAEGFSGSGSIRARKPGSAGIGSNGSLFGTGGLSARKAKAAGSGTESYISTANLTHKKVIPAATGSESFTGSGGIRTKKLVALGIQVSYGFVNVGGHELGGSAGGHELGGSAGGREIGNVR